MKKPVWVETVNNRLSPLNRSGPTSLLSVGAGNTLKQKVACRSTLKHILPGYESVLQFRILNKQSPPAFCSSGGRILNMRIMRMRVLVRRTWQADRSPLSPAYERLSTLRVRVQVHARLR